MKSTFWSEFFTRLKTESPEFFKRIFNWAIGATATFTATYGALEALPDDLFSVPSWLTKAYSYAVVVSVVIGIMAKSTVKDPNTLGKS